MLSLLTITGDSGLAAEREEILRTPDGVRFALLGKKRSVPAPTLFMFAFDADTTLSNKDYDQICRLLSQQGYLCVSLDLPCHGEDVREGEPQQLEGWAARAQRGEDFVRPFVSGASEVLDYLIDQGYTHAQRVAACGVSRGGFMAYQFAAADARVRCAAGFAPVTDLKQLREFSSCEVDAVVRRISLSAAAEKLADKAIWLCIGNNDERVGTDAAIAFAREVAQSAVRAGMPARVDLHVMVSDGHATPSQAHSMAADWILAVTQPPSSCK